MGIALSSETQQAIQDRLARGDYASADDLVRVALETLDRLEPDAVDEATLAAIDRAEAQYERGEGVAVDEAFDQVARRHFGDGGRNG